MYVIGHDPSTHGISSRLCTTQRFETEQMANERMETLKTYGYSNLLVRLQTWQEREKNRDYAEPVWINELPSLYPEHFAHVSLTDKSLVSFTASDAHGEADRQTIMKPGKYLKKYYQGLTEKQISFYAEWFVKLTRPPADISNFEVLFARTQAEIVWVYEQGPASCMKDMDCVRVYAAGDLAIAYMKNGEGTVMNRALCWPDKKVFGRVYPTPDAYDDDNEDGERYSSSEDAEDYQQALWSALKTAGFRSLSEDGTLFNGARLLKIESNDDHDEAVMPYLDSSMRLNDEGEFFIMNKSGYYCGGNTSGYMNFPFDNDDEYDEYDDDRSPCSSCGDMACDADLHYVTVGTQSAYWCHECIGEHAWICGYSGDRFSNDVMSIIVDGATWHASYVDHVHLNEETGEYTRFPPTTPTTITIINANMELVHNVLF